MMPCLFFFSEYRVCKRCSFCTVSTFADYVIDDDYDSCHEVKVDCWQPKNPKESGIWFDTPENSEDDIYIRPSGRRKKELAMERKKHERKRKDKHLKNSERRRRRDHKEAEEFNAVSEISRRRRGIDYSRMLSMKPRYGMCFLCLCKKIIRLEMEICLIIHWLESLSFVLFRLCDVVSL